MQRKYYELHNGMFSGIIYRNTLCIRSSETNDMVCLERDTEYFDDPMEALDNAESFTGKDARKLLSDKTQYKKYKSFDTVVVLITAWLWDFGKEVQPLKGDAIYECVYEPSGFKCNYDDWFFDNWQATQREGGLLNIQPIVKED